MNELFYMFKAFFKIGLFTFGGGLSMLPMLEREVVKNKGWTTEEELMNYYAIGQCTPGIIAVNVATFIGYKRKKLLGAIFATMGIIMPSLIIIISIAAFISNFAEAEVVKSVFVGIRIAVAALVTDTVIKMAKKGIKNLFGIVLFVIAFILSALFSVSPVIIVIAAILLSILYVKVIAENKERGN